MTLSVSEFDYVRMLLREEAAVVIDREKMYLAEARLQPLARQEGFDSISELIGALRTTSLGKLHERVVSAMTTHETSFFRDQHPFECLRTTVLPRLIELRKEERRLNLWCAACSTGQEPYSIAMLIREHFPELEGWTLNIVASDLSVETLARAQAGIYNTPEINRGLPAALLVKYFQEQEGQWLIKDEVRHMVAFHRMNLAGQWPCMTRMDLVLLRNVMIYFDTEVRRSILGRMERQLREDGFLFLGGAETVLNLSEAFEPVKLAGSICYRLRRDCLR